MPKRNYPVYKKKPFDESTLIDTFDYGDLKVGLTKKAIRRYHRPTGEWTILYHGLYNDLEKQWNSLKNLNSATGTSKTSKTKRRSPRRSTGRKSKT